MARKFKNIQKVIEKKIFLLILLVFSLFAISAQESENLKISDSEENLVLQENLASTENSSVSIRKNPREYVALLRALQGSDLVATHAADASLLNVSANLQNIFFEGAKYAITGISENYEAIELAKINIKNLKSFYSVKIATFDEKHHLIPLYIAEKLAPNHLGEIDSLYDSDDLVSYVETFAEDENALNFSGDWIDQAIALSNMQSSAPKTQLNDGQSLLDYLEKGDSRGIQEQDEEKVYKTEKNDEKNPESEEKKEFTYADKSGVLRRFFYDDEGMSVNQYDEKTYITRTYGNEIIRKCFDSTYRLESEEKLLFDSNPKNVKLTNQKTYTYDLDSVVPSSMKEEQKEKGIVIETEYNEKGLPKQVKTGHWQEDEIASKKYGSTGLWVAANGQNLEKSTNNQFDEIRNDEDNDKDLSGNGKSENDENLLRYDENFLTSDENQNVDISENQENDEKLNSENNNDDKNLNGVKPSQEEKPKTERNFYNDKLEDYQYDDENRVTEYELTTWSYRRNLFGRLITESLKTRYEYSYHDEKSENSDSDESNIPPDYKFYEDDVLRMERNYTTPDDYTEKMIFSDEFYVETAYIGGVKKQEIIYNNGKEARRRTF